MAKIPFSRQPIEKLTANTAAHSKREFAETAHGKKMVLP
jgi:hypothetical protein